jgi:hypothetical protein
MREFRSTNGHKPQSKAVPFEAKPIPVPAGSPLKLEQLVAVQQIEPNTKIRRRNLKLGRLSEVMPQPVQWLWPDRIARKVVLFTGRAIGSAELRGGRKCDGGSSSWVSAAQHGARRVAHSRPNACGASACSTANRRPDIASLHPSM